MRWPDASVRSTLRGTGASDPRTEPGIASAATEMAARRIVLEPGMMVMFFEVGAAGYVICCGLETQTGNALLSQHSFPASEASAPGRVAYPLSVAQSRGCASWIDSDRVDVVRGLSS